ncbi:MAG: transcriptional regulator [Nitriliruptorales bacterium]|nr:transcriptional regulator [Nitriliruptorales bacterium]
MGDKPVGRSDDRPVACEGAAAFELLGWRWTAFLIWALMDGPRRFSDLLDVGDGLSDRMLTKRLRELEGAGIVTRRRYREVPPRVEYALTDAGQALRPVIEAMEQWARRWTMEIHAKNSSAEGAGGIP